jgi:hypothetical protein
VVAAELMEIGPAIEPGRMTVVEDDADGVIADRLEAGDRHILLAGDGDLLAGAVAFHLGAWALDPEILGREAVAGAVVEGNLEAPAARLEADLLWPGGGGLSRHQAAGLPRPA